MRFNLTSGLAAALLTGALAVPATTPALAQTAGTDAGATTGAGAATEGQPAQDTQPTQDTQGAGTAQQAPAAAEAGTGTQPAQAGSGAAAADGPGYVLGDVVLGDPDAPLTVIEYASYTCPHCGSFAVHTFPKVKEQYVDTGKVKFILREVYFDQYGLWASMVARCGGEKGFYPLAESFLTSQSTWTRAPDIGHAIQQVGRRAGLSAERLEQCLSDRDFAKQLLADYQENLETDEIKSTPTFVINGEQHTGAMSFEEFAALLDAAL